MVDREIRWIFEGHFVSLPNAGTEDSESETLWHTRVCPEGSALSIPLAASDCIPPTPNGIAIFTCVRLAYKRKEVKGKFCGRVGILNAKAQSHSAASRNQRF
jgi:hypothetical protein